MRRLLVALLWVVSVSGAAAQVKSPEEFLGYKLGEKFSRHHRVVEYFRHVDEVSSNVVVKQYGETYEGRPLIYAVIASPENFARIEEIRQDNLKRAGLVSGKPAGNTAIVWLSYNVHGNEASSLEASMWTLFELVNEKNTKTKEWLKNTVVIMDPCINPDGRDRYANFYNQFGNLPANADPDSKEHDEYWPGGRFNHYLFDLNRDWAWLTQKESEQRLAVYQQWLPHVHVDFHEQGYNNPYYFAPAAEPYHEVITPWQREFQVTIGRNHAKYFDKEGWLYFTKEVFDLFYPSYGDTYPTYSGAIGMTYEQAGGGRGGLAVKTETGDPLTLLERLTHHHTTGLSTIEVASQHASRLIEEFEKYFRDNVNAPSSTYKTYVIKADNNVDKVRTLLKWLDKHQIKYGHTNAKASRGFNYQTQTSGTVDVTAQDIIISAYQPKSRFLTTVFEPVSKVPDSLTYDITAWNLIYGYDLKAFALTERLNVSREYQETKYEAAKISENTYAYLFPYKHVKDVAFLSDLLKAGVKVRCAERAFSIGGRDFSPGTLIVPRRNNEKVTGFDEVVLKLASKHQRPVFTTSTGFVDKGKDFGSSDLNFIKAPTVAALFGEETSPLMSGEIWHFFEQQIGYPVTHLTTQRIRHTDLSKYDVLIIPEGYYSVFDENVVAKISTWVSAGGRLILIGNAINSFAEKPGFNIKRFATEQEKLDAEKEEKMLKEREGFPRFDENERKQVSEFISGAIYKVAVDNSHPLGFGLGTNYYSLKTNELRFGFLENGWNIGVIKGQTKPVQGFAGYKANRRLTNSMVFGVQPAGAGEIVYIVDNPLFRAFWDNGKLLFSNAVFMVGQ